MINSCIDSTWGFFSRSAVLPKIKIFVHTTHNPIILSLVFYYHIHHHLSKIFPVCDRFWTKFWWWLMKILAFNRVVTTEKAKILIIFWAFNRVLTTDPAKILTIFWTFNRVVTTDQVDDNVIKIDKNSSLQQGVNHRSSWNPHQFW